MFNSKTYGTIGPKEVDSLSGPELVTLFNELVSVTGGKATKRFSTRVAGVKRCLAEMEKVPQDKPNKPSAPKNKKGPALFNLPEAEEIGVHRPNTRRGQVIRLGTRPEGTTLEELIEKCEDWDRVDVRNCLYGIHTYLGHGVQERDGRIYITGKPRGRKLFNFPAGPELKTPREGTKRRNVLDLLQTKEGATVEEIKSITGWTDHQALECVRILNVHCGYAISEDDEGNISGVGLMRWLKNIGPRTTLADLRPLLAPGEKLVLGDPKPKGVWTASDLIKVGIRGVYIKKEKV